MHLQRFATSIALGALAVGSLTGCTNTDGVERATLDPSVIADITVDEEASALVPADIRESGALRIGINPNYPPNEYKDASGAPAGWGVDIGDAVAAKLGLTAEWQVMQFDRIIPRIQAGALDMSSSSFTDTRERQQSVDFVDYYEAGSQWASTRGQEVDPENACGLTIAVKSTTIQETEELPARNQQCVDAGKKPISIVSFTQQPEATQAVASGAADAFSADSPITGDAVAQLGDQLQLAGDVFDTAPYGFVTPKGSGLTMAVERAVQSLIDDGTYLAILKSAGVEAGAVQTAVVNGATD